MHKSPKQKTTAQAGLMPAYAAARAFPGSHVHRSSAFVFFPFLLLPLPLLSLSLSVIVAADSDNKSENYSKSGGDAGNNSTDLDDIKQRDSKFGVQLCLVLGFLLRVAAKAHGVDRVILETGLGNIPAEAFDLKNVRNCGIFFHYVPLLPFILYCLYGKPFLCSTK